MQRDIVKVKQESDNDCFPACVASITGLPKEDMPHLKHPYIYKFTKRNSKWHGWQQRNGYRFLVRYKGGIIIPKDEYYIAFHELLDCPGWSHAVVSQNGVVVHNPYCGIVGSRKAVEPLAVLTLERIGIS